MTLEQKRETVCPKWSKITDQRIIVKGTLKYFCKDCNDYSIERDSCEPSSEKKKEQKPLSFYLNKFQNFY